MRALVHSIHSQVPATISALGLHVRTIVSMDSHLDVSLGGDEAIYPEELRLIVARTGAHSALRKISGGLSALKGGEEGAAPSLVVAVPEAMLARHATDVESKLPRSLRLAGQEEAVASAVDFLAREMGIEVYSSPPNSLLGILPRVRRAGRLGWLLDVDVDYMEEMQRECYTRIIDPAPGVLQSMGRVLEFVRRSRPETITISEAKVAAIRDPRSAFSRFLGELRAEGYDIHEQGVFASDAEVVRGIRVCREFYRKVSGRLMLEHMGAMMRGETAGFRRAEAAAAKEFFAARGYG